MTTHFLQNIFEKSINGEWGNEDSGKGEATAVIRTSNFLNSGRLNLDNIVCRDIDKNKNSDKILRTGDIIIEKSGGSPNQPVGRVVYFDVTDQDYFTNNFTSILRVKPGYNSKYIFYLMKYLYDTKKVLKFQNQTTGIINLKLTDYLNKTKVNIETIENQNTIVDILDRLEYRIINRNKQLSELSNLVKSRFNEMFGDPVLNEMGWEIETLNKIGTIGRGVSKHRPRNASELFGGIYPFIQTGDVANSGNYIVDYHSTYSEFGLKQSKLWDRGTLCITIAANIAKTSILAFDSCFPDSIVGFIPGERTNNMFIHYWFSYFQKILESQAPESAQKNINLKILSELKVILPPLSLQNEFADFVAKIDKSQFACQKAIKLWRNSLKSSII